MQKRRSIKIISVVLIIVLICISVIYAKSDNSYVLATTSTYNTENLQDNEHMHVELDSSGDKVPVPNGYVGSSADGENEIDKGYVIYEGEEEVNNENVEEAQKTRNQYVWIPVPDASTMYGTDSNGKKWGKLYDFTTDMGEGIDPVTGAKPLNWSESNGIINISTGSFREPDVVIKNDIDNKLKTLNVESINTHNFLEQLEKEFNCMISSIEKYGGFYIGRYETGDLNKEKVVIRKGNTDIGNQTWYIMYSKIKNLSNSNNNIQTSLIWGNQWYRTIAWLIETKSKNINEILKSTSWGNYKNSEFNYLDNSGNSIIKEEGKSLKIPTGSTEYTKANNIYDLAGNVNEWTMISYSNYSRSDNAGNYDDTGSSCSVLRRHEGDTLSKANFIRLPCNVIY